MPYFCMQTVPQVPQTHNQHQRKSCDSMQQQIMQAGTIISKLFVCNTSNEFHECYETPISIVSSTICLGTSFTDSRLFIFNISFLTFCVLLHDVRGSSHD